MPLLALAKLAYQKYGFHLGFETDYVPEAFYTRNMPEPRHCVAHTLTGRYVSPTIDFNTSDTSVAVCLIALWGYTTAFKFSNI
ncbi:immunity 49 family protein [Vibrio hyugaensis]|uniref:immunity 49 family protein n=1 Tax=Vibrio hyugaensis TaxID=1534743 RepID=UPI001E490243|nr:immunity 49 family protein [Vibrio hyugaensis]